jgi:hypothetical protein
MSDDEALARLEAKIDSLGEQLARQAPMTPGRAAAEARAAMSRGYEAEARERAAKAAKAAEGGGDDE